MCSSDLLSIAESVSGAGTVADIGTDHGYIPIWLTQQKACRKVILSDINAGPLEKARENIGRHLPEVSFDIRHGAGISVLRNGEADAVIIAGMGGILIRDILAEDEEKTKSFPKFILQPRNYSRRLRAWIGKTPYLEITDESLACEGRRLCEIMTVERTDCAQTDSVRRRKEAVRKLKEELAVTDELEREIPLLYYTENRLYGLDFVKRKVRQESEIIDRIRRNSSPGNEDAEERMRRSEERLAQFRRIEAFALSENRFPASGVVLRDDPIKAADSGISEYHEVRGEAIWQI